MNKAKDVRIVMEDNRIITRMELFRKKELFHKEIVKIPFKEKIKILISLQKIVNTIQKPSKLI